MASRWRRSKERRAKAFARVRDGDSFSVAAAAALILPHLAADPTPEDGALADLLAHACMDLMVIALRRTE